MANKFIEKLKEMHKKRVQKRLDSYEVVDYPRGENQSFQENVSCNPQGCRVFEQKATNHTNKS